MANLDPIGVGTKRDAQYKNNAPRLKKCQHLSLKWHIGQSMWYERFKSYKYKRTKLHPNRHPVLCKPWSVERWALRQQKWCMELRLCPLRNDYPETSVRCWGHAGTLPKSVERSLSLNTRALLARTKSIPSFNASNKSKIKTRLLRTYFKSNFQ